MAAPLHTYIVRALVAFQRQLERHAESLSKAVLLGPFILGPLIFSFGSDSEALIESAKRFLAFLLLFAGWEMLVGTLMRVRLHKETADKSTITAAEEALLKIEQKKLKKKLKAAALGAIEKPVLSAPAQFSRGQKLKTVLAIVIILASLEIYRGYFIEAIFLLLLLTLTCSVLGELWGRKNPLMRSRYLLALTPKLLYYMGVGYLSCLAIAGNILYQPLVIAAGMASMAIAPGTFNYLVYLSQNGEASAEVTTERKYLQRAHALLLVFGPLSIALLVYGKQFPTSYLLVFLSLAVGSRLLQKIPRNGAPVDGSLAWLSALTSLTFLGVFIALRVL